MRRKDREITELSDLMGIMKKAPVCRVAFFDGDYPYIVPLNFGVTIDNEKLILYFHCAAEGKKLSLLKRNNKVAFEIDCPGKYIDGAVACDSTMAFESVCGNGVITIVPDEEKLAGLTALMGQYSDKSHYEFDEGLMKAVTVLKLTVNDITGKRLKMD